MIMRMFMTANRFGFFGILRGNREFQEYPPLHLGVSSTKRPDMAWNECSSRKIPKSLVSLTGMRSSFARAGCFVVYLTLTRRTLAVQSIPMSKVQNY